MSLSLFLGADSHACYFDLIRVNFRSNVHKDSFYSYQTDPYLKHDLERIEKLNAVNWSFEYRNSYFII
jgi:hypothetical protein